MAKDYIFSNGFGVNFKDLLVEYLQDLDLRSISTNVRIDDLILESGDSSAEIVDARGIFGLLGARLDDIDSKITSNALKVNLAKTVYVENYPKLTGEPDDTLRAQRAIDDAPEYSEIRFDTTKTYELTNLDSTKALDINFNGASVICNLHPTNQPLIHFKGTVGASNPLSVNAVGRSLTISVAGASSLFARHDYIIVGDNKSVPSWDGVSGFPYTGQSEINIVVDVSGDVITLAKPIEWNYNTADGGYAQKITKLLKSPRVRNVGYLTEIDPLTTSASANAGNGHLFQFEYAVLPLVEDVYIDGWQLHAVNFYRCIHGLAGRVQAYKPYRPQSGGHGYVIKYDNSWGGVARENTAHRARHVIDWSRTYDGISKENFSYFPYGVSYYTHGLGSKRSKSIDDTVMGIDSASEGWAMGNPSFTADYDYTIINPVYRGNGLAVGMKTLSKNMKIINPDFYSDAKEVIQMSRGAEDLTIIGGEIDCYHPSGTNYYAVLARGNSGDSDPVVADIKNVTIRGTRIKGNAIVYIDCLGTINVDDLECDVTPTSNGGLTGALRISPILSAEDVNIRRCRLSGSFDRGIYLTTAPSRHYRVEGNEVSGYNVTYSGIQVRASANLRLLGNDVIGASNQYGFSGTIATEIANGMVMANNSPNTSHRRGSATFSGDGTTVVFVIPHGCLTTPTFWDVSEANQVAGTAEIDYRAISSTNITFRFKTAPVTGTNNVLVTWRAEI